MMFVMHISGLLALGVLLGSTALIVWARQNKGEGVCFAKKVGVTTFVIAILSLICMGYYAVKYWSQGEFESSRPMHMGMQKEMMENMMPQMMQHMGNMMGGMMGNKGDMGTQSGGDHSAHHPES